MNHRWCLTHFGFVIVMRPAKNSLIGMHFLPMLGKKLKDIEVIEVLERLDMDVIYDFDRLHEGQPDQYWAASKSEGFQFKFDETQTLVTVFLHLAPSDGFPAMSRYDCDIPFFTTAEEVQKYGQTRHLAVTKGSADFLGVRRVWVRLGFASYSAHYEFHGESLAQITLTRMS